MLSPETPPMIYLGALPAIETDCACPTPPPVALPSAEYGVYERARNLHIRPLQGDWSLYCNPLAGGAPAVLNQPAIERLGQFVTAQPLAQPYDHQLVAARLLAPVGVCFPAPQGQPMPLTAWLHVTNACNLDCPYCYVRKSAARMDLATGIRAIDALVTTARKHGFTGLKLKYAGGEAALHYRLVRQLHAYAVEQAAQHGLELSAVVLSNGTVVPPAFADWLAASGVRLMLSVDGVGDDHDAQRPLKGGGVGAFAALERNLHERLLPRQIRPDICITVTASNAATAQLAVRWALRHQLPFSLNFYRETDYSARFRELQFEEQQIISGMLAAYRAIEQELPETPFLDGLLDRVQAQAHSHACGVGQSYVVITHSGQVAQCQMELQQAQPFDAASDLIRLVATGPIINHAVDSKEGCRSCEWRYRCAGGCPLVTLRATGRTDIQSPNCAIYRALFPEALRLEGLRILKVQGIISATAC